MNAEPAGGNLHVAEALLQQAHPPDAASTIFKEKVRQRPLLLRPTSPDPSRDTRAKRQHTRLQKANAQRKSRGNKPKPLSAKQKRALCVYEIPVAQRKYAIYEPLHELWCEYIREVLGLQPAANGGAGRTYVDGNGAGPMLASADYHGARLEVVRSRCVSRVGLQGIVVKDNKFSFELVTRRNEVKLVPKEHTVFRFEVPFQVEKEEEVTCSDRNPDTNVTLPKEQNAKRAREPLVFEIHGSQFETRAPDRATKKFRLHFDPDL